MNEYAISIFKELELYMKHIENDETWKLLLEIIESQIDKNISREDKRGESNNISELESRMKSLAAYSYQKDVENKTNLIKFIKIVKQQTATRHPRQQRQKGAPIVFYLFTFSPFYFYFCRSA